MQLHVHAPSSWMESMLISSANGLDMFKVCNCLCYLKLNFWMTASIHLSASEDISTHLHPCTCRQIFYPIFSNRSACTELHLYASQYLPGIPSTISELLCTYSVASVSASSFLCPKAKCLLPKTNYDLEQSDVLTSEILIWNSKLNTARCVRSLEKKNRYFSRNTLTSI